MEPLQLLDIPVQFRGGPLELKLVSADSAADWMGKYHYSGTRGVASSLPMGIFDGDLVGVVCIGPTANADGVVRKYELQAWPGNHEITRVAIHPDANTYVSQIVNMALDYWHKASGDDWVFSYADTGQNHHGGIYQALNAVYMGVSEGRPGWLLNGESIHPRSVVARYGTQAKVEAPLRAAARGEELTYVEVGLITAKHAYVLPIGDRKTRRDIRRHLAQWAKPYPKRT